MKAPLSHDLDIGVDRNTDACKTVEDLARIITRQFYFAKDGGGKLYFYKHGVYYPGGDQFIAELVKQIVEHFDKIKHWKSHKTRELCEYIRADAGILWERPPLDRINVKNGILDTGKRQLLPHTPEFLSTVQLPVNYDPAATCPQWERFAAETLPSDAPAVAWEIAAWLMVPHTRLQKALLLLRSGSNGKSTYLRGLIEFLGRPNTCSIALHKLESDRFASSRLLGKLANICSDLPNRKLKTTSTFKAITGEDAVMMDYKFGDSFDAHPFSRLVFSANELPRSNDSSDGFYRRWIILPFTKTFNVDPEIGEKVSRALANPKELSGVLNKALEALPDVMRRGITIAPSMEEALDNYRRLTEPLAVWLDAETESDPSSLMPKRLLRDGYNEERAAQGELPMPEEAFGRALKRLRPQLEEGQRMIDGSRRWVYLGIRFKERSRHRNH